MRTLALALLLAGCSSSCAGTKPTVNWPRVVTCTEPVQHDLLNAVTSILLSDTTVNTIGDRAVRELTDMATRHGEHVVACLVDEAVRSLEHVAPVAERKSMSRAPSPVVPFETLPDDGPNDAPARAAARGKDFLKRVAQTQVHAPDAETP